MGEKEGGGRVARKREAERGGKKRKKGNKSLTSSAHCDTLTLLSFVDQ